MPPIGMLLRNDPVRTFLVPLHTRALHVDLEANKAVETPDGNSAQPAEASVLVLHTIGPANRAYVGKDDAGRVNLHFRGLRYGVDDYLPSSVFGLSTSPSVTAGEFVCRQMHWRFGHDENEWPALVRQFLINHKPSHSNRSREQEAASS